MHWNINTNYKKIKTMRLTTNLMIFGIGLLFISCTNIKPLEVKYQSIEGSGFYSTSAATKSSIVRKKGDNHVICAEPAPDATFDMQDDTSLDMSLMNIGNKEAEGTSDSEVEAGLGGRSVNVLLTREMLFRMCEFFSNTNLDDSTKVRIYQSTLASILQINTLNFGTGTRNGAVVNGTLVPSMPNISLPKDTNPSTSSSNDEEKENDEGCDPTVENCR